MCVSLDIKSKSEKSFSPINTFTLSKIFKTGIIAFIWVQPTWMTMWMLLTQYYNYPELVHSRLCDFGWTYAGCCCCSPVGEKEKNWRCWEPEKTGPP